MALAPDREQRQKCWLLERGLRQQIRLHRERPAPRNGLRSLLMGRSKEVVRMRGWTRPSKPSDTWIAMRNHVGRLAWWEKEG